MRLHTHSPALQTHNNGLSHVTVVLGVLPVCPEDVFPPADSITLRLRRMSR